MRRLTGTYDGERYRLFEFDNGVVDCPPTLRQDLLLPDGLRLPTGESLENACLVLFGESLEIEEF